MALEKRLELLQRLNAIQGINLPDSSVNRLPKIHLCNLTSPNVLDDFLTVIAWTVEEVRQHGRTSAR